MGTEVDEYQIAVSHLIDQKEIPANMALSGTSPLTPKLMVQILRR